MILAAIIITSIYCLLIISFSIGFDLVKPFILKTFKAENSFSIIIPFRNEAQALPNLLKSLKQLEYPTDKFEIIFIDDVSDDNSAEIIKQFFTNTDIDIKILANRKKSDSPKKEAIEMAITNASFNWIITTDADCEIPRNWLHTFSEFIEAKKTKMIVAPVTYNCKATFLEQFQHLDFLSLIGSTIGGFGIKKPFLCNGANLCYSKQAFLNVNGFEGNTNIASGDDIFLLEKMIDKYPDKVHFLKSHEAIVITKPQQTFSQLINQRIRWAAKSTAYKNNFSKLVSLSVFSMNILVLILFLGSLISSFSCQFFISIFLIKFCLDFILLFKTVRFFKQQSVLKHYFWSSIVYPIFIIFITLNSFTSSYTWKDRSYKK